MEDPYPTLAIYKTSEDYFHYMNINIIEDTVVRRFVDITEEGAKLFTLDGVSGYEFRVPLEDGYVLAGSAWPDDFFTNLTIGDYYELYDQQFVNGENINLGSIFRSHIVDEDPFLEYYSVDGSVVYDVKVNREDYPGLSIEEVHFRMFLNAAKKINETIRSNILESTYTRIK